MEWLKSSQRSTSFQCPYCRVVVFLEILSIHVDVYSNIAYYCHKAECPNCNQLLLFLTGEDAFRATREPGILIWPNGKDTARPPVPLEVSDPAIAQDYKEACEVLPISPKASAALSRRCLQHILREKLQTKPANLDKEIQQVIDNKLVPTYLVESLDAVRTNGNFATHPIKSTSTGEIVDVELDEAEWNLDAIEGLFDFVYVQPAKSAARAAKHNKKLADVGKPPLKQKVVN